MSPDNVVDCPCLSLPGLLPREEGAPLRRARAVRSLLLAAVGTSRRGAVTTSLTPSTWLARPSPSLSDLRATASRRDCLVRWRSCVCLLANLSRREECLGHGNAEADSEVALDSDRSTREGEWGHDLVFAMAGGDFAVSRNFFCLALAVLIDMPSCHWHPPELQHSPIEAICLTSCQ